MEKLADISQLSDRVIRILGQNSSPFTLQGTNCYLVGTGKSRALIDSGSGLIAFNHLLSKAMNAFGVEKIGFVILTHHHIDHIGGVKRLAEQRSLYDKVLTVFVPDVDSIWREIDSSIEYRQIHQGQVLACQGASLECWLSPGHTSDSLCLWLGEESSLFSGDTILGENRAPIIENLREYLNTLYSLRQKMACCSPSIVVYPGHGQVVKDGPKSLDMLIQRRMKRNSAILDALGKQPLSSLELSALIYDRMSPDLRLAALGTLKAHLEFLQEEALIEYNPKEGKYKLLGAKAV